MRSALFAVYVAEMQQAFGQPATGIESLPAACPAGNWQDQQGAIKVLSYQRSSDRAFEAFSECLVSQRLHHPNVVCALNTLHGAGQSQK